MKNLWINFMCLFMTPEQQVEYQLKKRFKAKKITKKVICEYCGKLLTKGTKHKEGDRIGRWVYGDGTTTYHCMACSDYIDEQREKAKKDFCICYKHGYEPTIERCHICPDIRNCEKILRESDEKTIEQLKPSLAP